MFEELIDYYTISVYHNRMFIVFKSIKYYQFCKIVLLTLFKILHLS
jgi:hypothetical protein